MNVKKIQGTLTLDGMVQGKLDGSPQSQASLRHWHEQAQEMGLHFNLEIEGGTFNALADNAPIPAHALGDHPQEAIAAAIEALVTAVPAPFRRETLSTVRSVEIQAGCEVQTLYAIGPDGKVQFRDRTVNAETVAPPMPLTLKEKLKLAGVGLAVLLGLLAVSAIFVDYRTLIGDMIRQATPFKPEKVDVRADDFAGLFTVKEKAKSADGKTLLLTIERTKDYPRTDAQLDTMLSQLDAAQAMQARLVMAGAVLDAMLGSTTRPASGPEQTAASSPSTLPGSSSAPTTRPASLTRLRLTLEALAKGYVRCECFDAEGNFLGFATCRIAELRSKETSVLTIPLTPDKRLAKLVVTF